VAELRPRILEIRAAGGDLVIIGSGSPSSAKAFQDDLGIGDVRVFSDETLRAYERGGFRRGLLTLLRPAAIGNYVRAFLSGHQQKRKQGDALQQGGVMVVHPDGTVLFRHASRSSGDHPPLESIIAAVRP